MKLAIQYVWCSFVAWLVLRTFGFTPEEFRAQRRELAMARTEIDRHRVAYVRMKDVIDRMKRDAITLPSMQVAEPITRRSMRAAPPCVTEYLAITPVGEDVEVPR